ncbi:MAG: hypothetical protein Q9165_007499 [Trypethelium subeluteriae]
MGYVHNGSETGPSPFVPYAPEVVEAQESEGLGLEVAHKSFGAVNELEDRVSFGDDLKMMGVDIDLPTHLDCAAFSSMSTTSI